MSSSTFSAVLVRPDGLSQIQFEKRASREQHMNRVREVLAVPGCDCEGIPLYIPGYRLTAYISTHRNQDLHRFPFNQIMTQLYGQPILGNAIILDEKPEDSTDCDDGDQDYHKSFELSDLSRCLDVVLKRAKQS